MTYVSQEHQQRLGDVRYTQLFGYHSPLGYQPETGDKLLVPLKDRYSGTYILGVLGVGKSGLLENLILHDIHNNQAIIVIDPHGDLTGHCIAQMSPEMLSKTYILDLEDEDYPFGLNVFNPPKQKTAVAFHQAIDRVMHCFQALWPDVLEQQHLPRYLRASIITLFANPGSTLVDMYKLLVIDSYRRKMLENVKDDSVHQFWQVQYDELSGVDRFTRVRPLLGRLEALFMGKDLIKNIVGQRQTTIDFRSAIENKEIIFIRLPIKTLAQDSKLIGTLLIAQIHAAIFSFADLPEDKRPGFSLYVDEFQHFATSDFSEMFTEGRKFGVRLTLAHQYRHQIPEFLRASTLTARTIVCFRTQDDSKEMAHSFLNGSSTVEPEDIETKPVEYLLQHGSDIEYVRVFIDFYLRHQQGHSGDVEIHKPGFRWRHVPYMFLSVPTPDNKPIVANPIHRLNALLHEVMKTGNSNLPIHADIVKGFSNCGLGFYAQTRFAGRILYEESYPPELVANGRWTREPEHGKEQLYHFLFHLRQTMKHLAESPLGKKSIQSSNEVARMLTQLPNRAAFVHTGDTTGVIYTDMTVPLCSVQELGKRFYLIRGQTRQKYCSPKVATPPPLEPKGEPPISRWEEVE